jgi:hypothetical protein
MQLVNMVTALAVASAVLVTSEAIAQSRRIGVAAATKNSVEATLAGKTRQLSAGTEVFASEAVRTGEASAAQLLFLDETSLSIGPRSQVTLDRFVYDPDRAGGSMVISATRGALRFISGSQASSAYQIKTPVATIGIRGTVFQIYVQHTVTGQPVVYVLWVEGTGAITLASRTISMREGQAIVLTNATVEGPFTWPWTGHLTDLQGDLYGLSELPDYNTLRDQLFGKGSAPPQPPPPVDIQ